MNTFVWQLAGLSVLLGTCILSCQPQVQRQARQPTQGGGVSVVVAGREGHAGQTEFAAQLGVGPQLRGARWRRAVWCWGAGGSGQLGNGTTEDQVRLSKSKVSAELWRWRPASTTAALAARRATLFVGEPTTPVSSARGRSGLRRAGPSLIAGMQGVLELKSGARHNCVRTARGRVVCWGDNSLGQLGDGTLTSRAKPDPNDPKQAVGGVDDAVELALGRDFSCARLRSGRVKCWGDHVGGAIGLGRFAGIQQPAEVPSVSDATRIVAGEFHACVLRRRANPVCFGLNGSGQLDPSSVVGGPPGILEVAGFDPQRQLGCGGWSHLHGRSGHDDIRCWGDNRSGQLGIQSTARQRFDKSVRGGMSEVRGLRGAVQIAAGRSHSARCSATPQARCRWSVGAKTNAVSSATAKPARRAPAKVVKGLPPVAKLAGGDHHTCALTKTVKFGAGAATETGGSAPTQQRTPPSPSGSARCGIRRRGSSLGGAHTCALLASGKVACWGSNEKGQTGQKAGTSHAEPARCPGSCRCSLSLRGTATRALRRGKWCNVGRQQFGQAGGDEVVIESTPPQSSKLVSCLRRRRCDLHCR